MTFAAPMWLWALLVLPLIVVGELWSTRHDRERTARLVARPLWGRVVRRPRELWRWLRVAFLFLGVTGLILALARPQWGIVRERVEREGVDVVLVLDTSGSMATEDVQPNRFFFARAAMFSLIERLSGDRFALVAFEGEAYPLVPLTLDADAIGLFLETLEPGAVPTPGTSLGVGLARGIDMFVDEERNNKVLILVSDGEDLEGEIQGAVQRATKEGVVIHTVGVGTQKGAPVPDYDRQGERVGFKRAEDGSAVVSRLDPATLQAIARATGGVYVPLSGVDTSLWQIAAAIEGMEQRTLAREFSYRRKERFQIPLALALAFLTLGLVLPFPALRRRRKPAAAEPAAPAKSAARAAGVVAAILLAAPGPTTAQEGKLLNELTLRPQRLTSAGRRAYADGDHPKALESFEQATGARSDDLRTQFNLADALYKAGNYDEAAAIFAALAARPDSPLSGPALFNLGNTLFQRQQFADAVTAYKGVLELTGDDLDARHNLELALRALEEQEKQQQQQQQDSQEEQDQQEQEEQQQDQQQQQQQQRPKSEEEKEQERFQKETGMPKERAMQLLEALQQNEKEEQKKQLAAQRAGKKKGKDW